MRKTKKGRHKTLDKHLKNNILWVEQVPGIKKVILGISEPCRHKYPPGHIRYTMNVEGGFKVIGYSGVGVVDIFIKVEPIALRESIKAKIAERFKVP